MAGIAGPVHVLSYGTLLGMTIWHSFPSGIIMFKTLQRPDFGALQANLLPVYFYLQIGIPVVLGLTHPDNGSGILKLDGLLAPENKWGVLVPLVSIFASSLVNLTLLFPASTKVRLQRHDQAKKDGKRYWDPPPHSEEMIALNRQFGKLHGISSLLNMITVVGSIAYGIHLGGRI